MNSGMRTSPGRAEIAPVGAVPVPVADLLDLTLHRVSDGSAAQAQRRLAHLQRPEDLLREKVLEGPSGDPHSNLGCQQEAHALVPHVGSGFEQEWRAASLGNEVSQR